MARCGKSAMIFRRNRKIANCNEFRLGIQPQWAIHGVGHSFYSFKVNGIIRLDSTIGVFLATSLNL